MPLPEIMGPDNEIDPRRLKAMGLTLLASIRQAHRRGHVTCGMKASAELLQSEPAAVMLCVLPADPSDIAANINQMLIEAFCRENLIPILKTNEQHKISALITKLDAYKKAKKTVNGDASDTTCVLIQYPKLGPSKQDEMLTEFHSEMMANPHPMPYLTLPD